MPVRALLHRRQRTEHNVVGLAWQLVLDGALLGTPQQDAAKECVELRLLLYGLPQCRSLVCTGRRGLSEQCRDIRA